MAINKLIDKPTDARPYEGDCWHRVDVCDKYIRNVGFSMTEKTQFELVCDIGVNQLIKCYGPLFPRDFMLTVFDFCSMCCHCPHCKSKNFINAERCLRTFETIKNIDTMNPYDPSSVFKSIEEYLDETGKSKWFVYFISDGIFIKIGKAKNVAGRLNSLQTGNARLLEILFSIRAKDERSAYEIEHFLHNHFADSRLEGEWFDIKEKLQTKKWAKLFA